MLKIILFSVFLFSLSQLQKDNASKFAVEPTTGKSFPKKIRNCYLKSVGTMDQFIHYEQNFLLFKKTLFDDNVQIGAFGVFECRPSSLMEEMYLMKPSHMWVSLFEMAVEWVVFGWKYPDGKPVFSEVEKTWMHKVGLAFKKTITTNDDVLIIYNKNRLKLYLDGEIMPIEGASDIYIPPDQFRRVMDRILKTAYTVKMDIH